MDTKEQSSSPPNERWIIEINGDRYLFRREINGKPNETYAPVGQHLAAIYAIAIINGYEPPRQLKIKDNDGFIAHQDRHQDSVINKSSKLTPWNFWSSVKAVATAELNCLKLNHQVGRDNQTTASAGVATLSSLVKGQTG